VRRFASNVCSRLCVSVIFIYLSDAFALISKII